MKVFNIHTRTVKKVSGLLTALLVLVCIDSCHLRPLEIPENSTEIQIEIITRTIQNVTCDVYNDKIPLPEIDPEVMHVLFYEYETENFVTEAFISNKSVTDDGRTYISGNMFLDPGKYKMLAYNFGTISTIIKDRYSWQDAMAYTNNVEDYISNYYKAHRANAYSNSKKSSDALVSEGSSDTKDGFSPMFEIVVNEPDHLFVLSHQEEIIPVDTDVHVIKGEANSIVDTYYLQVKIEGVEYVSEAQAFITNLSGGNMLSSNERLTDPVNTVYFRLIQSDDKGVPVLCNVFNTFGHLDNMTNHLTITFDIRTADGRLLMKTFDISDLFYTPEAIEHHWLLLDETITIEPPKEGGGGMDPSVGNWDEERVDINI